MTNWAFFVGLFNTLITPVMAQIMAMLGAMCGQMQPVALAMAAATLGIMGADVAAGTRTWQQFFKDMFVAGLLIGLLQMAQYQQYVSTFFLQGLPNTISAALGGNGSPVAGLDNILNSAVTATMKVYEALPSYSLKTIPLALAMLCFLVIDAICVAFAFFVYTLAAISNVLVVVVGPIFLAAGVAPWSRFLLIGWFRVLVGGCVTQLLAVAVLQLLSGAEVTQLNTVAAATIGGDNAIGQIWALCQSAILIALCTAVVKKAPEIATAIAGGVHHAAAAAAGSFGAAGAVTNVMNNLAGGGAAAAGSKASAQVGAGAVRAMSSRPTGPSLSKASP